MLQGLGVLLRLPLCGSWQKAFRITLPPPH
jgi:hypothetical protein